MGFYKFTGLLAKVTAVCWLKGVIESLEKRAAAGEFRFGVETEIHELREVLRYLKAAPAPKPRRNQ